MKKALVILLTASMLAVGCGSGSGGASSAAAPEAEEKVEEEAPQEEAEAEAAPEADAAAAEAEENLEVEASDALNAVSQAVDEAEQTEAAEQTEEAAEEAEAPATQSLADNEEVLEGAQEVLSKTSAFTSDLGKSEKNDYGEDVEYSYDFESGGLYCPAFVAIFHELYEPLHHVPNEERQVEQFLLLCGMNLFVVEFIGVKRPHREDKSEQTYRQVGLASRMPLNQYFTFEPIHL